MKKRMKILLLSATVLLLTSCLSSGIDITINKDGSGEIVHTFHVLREYMAFMDLGEAEADPNMINMQALSDLADSMGEGVSLDRVEAEEDSSPYGGYRAFYSFTDISRVRTSTTPMTTPGETIDPSDLVRFKFKKGGTPVLSVFMPPTDDGEEKKEDSEPFDSEEPDEEAQAQIEQMKQVFRSMHYWFKIKVNGNIGNTNALYREENEIIILDMNFDRIVENDRLFTRLTSDNNANLKDVKEDLEKAGVRIDDQEHIEISFR